MNKNKFLKTGASSVIVIIILVIIVAAGLIYFLQSQKGRIAHDTSQKSSDTSSPVEILDFEATPIENNDENTKGEPGIIVSQIFTVIYTDAGYSPKEITIRVGDTVEFENNSSRSVWTASYIHPTHKILPEFDALKGYAPGETYSYLFKEFGTWQYHNHLKPSQTGTIIVRE